MYEGDDNSKALFHQRQVGMVIEEIFVIS